MISFRKGNLFLILRDASIYADEQQPHESFTYPGYMPGEVSYYDGEYGTCTIEANNNFA